MDQPSEKPELLHGMKDIAECLGLTQRQAQHLHETGDLPTFKIGRTVCARRTGLSAWLAALEAKAKGGGQ